ncbi:unnamed protein product, partial [marine sediment metagenome]
GLDFNLMGFQEYKNPTRAKAMPRRKTKEFTIRSENKPTDRRRKLKK